MFINVLLIIKEIKMSVKVEVKLWPKREGGIGERQGFVKIDGFVQININVMKNDRGGYWISYPSYKKADGTWQETAGPVNKEARDFILDSVMKYMQSEGSADAQPKTAPVEQTKTAEATRRDPGSMEVPF